MKTIKEIQKEAKGTIIWIDEECVGFKCECGNPEEITVNIYEDMDNSCPKCGRDYVLRQTNTVYYKKSAKKLN